MKSLATTISIAAALFAVCAPAQDKPYPFTELVMQPGDSITAETPTGKVTIAADDLLVRTVTWEGESRSVRLIPRPKRWYGSLGAYNRDNEDVREHHGITRIVFEDGQQHFDTIEQALTWLRGPWYKPRSVYSDDGVFIQFSKTLEREQLNVDVVQIYIHGHKPTKLPGSQNDKVQVTHKSKDTQPSDRATSRVVPSASNIAPTQPKESEIAAARRIIEAFDKSKYPNAMAKLKSAKNGESRFEALNDAAKESLNHGHDADAKSFAEELERLAPEYKESVNYGNAVQDFNIVLGRLALKAGDVEAAKKRLIAAGHSPRSPQMDSFGPNMTLARDLLAKGEKAVVLEYFELCRRFWKMDHGKLNQWKKDVERNRVPDFGANLDY